MAKKQLHKPMQMTAEDYISVMKEVHAHIRYLDNELRKVITAQGQSMGARIDTLSNKVDEFVSHPHSLDKRAVVNAIVSKLSQPEEDDY